jgi:hypothetical protein
MSDDTLVQVQELIDSAMSSLKTANALLRDVTGVADTGRERNMLRASSMTGSSPASGRVIEGIFDGQNMVDSKGQTYPVPANYASKSKLVEGEVLGINSSVAALAMSIPPILSGYIAADLGPNTSIHIAGFVILLSAVVFWLFYRPKQAEIEDIE